MAEQPKNVWEALSFAWDFGFIIAVPLIVLGTLGKYADARWGTKPLASLIGIGLAIVISSVWMYQHLAPFVGQRKTQNAKGKNEIQNSKLP